MEDDKDEIFRIISELYFDAKKEKVISQSASLSII